MFKSLLLLLIATAANAIPIRYDNPSTGGISEVTADGRYWVRTGTAATGNYSLSGGSWSFVLGGSTFSVSCNGDRCFRVSGSGEITGNMIVGSTLTVQGNAFSVGGSSFVVSGGKVGILTASPQYPLDVNGDSRVAGQSMVVGSNTVLGDSSLKKVSATQVDVSGGILGSGVLQVTGDSTLQGAVGVGITTGAASALHVAGTLKLSGQYCNSNGGNCIHLNSGNEFFPVTNGGVTLGTSGNNWGHAYFNQATLSGPLNNGLATPMSYNSSAGHSFDSGYSQFGSGPTRSTFTAAGLLQLVSKSTITTGNGTLSFSTAASAGLTTQTPIFITADGRVGIGGNRFNVAPSGSPTAPDGNVLMMFGKGTDDGAMEAMLFTGQGSGGPAGAGSYTTSEKIILHNFPGNKAAIFTPTTGSIGFTATGNVTSHIPFFTLAGAGTPSERMRVHSDGNVGISTNAPTSTLHVAGSASFGSIGQSSFTAQGFWEPFSRTKAQIDALTPTKVGQIIYASDTTLPGLCISTGTAVAQWRKMEGPAGLGCGTNN